MITKLKSNIEVSTNLIDLSIKNTIYCEIENFIQNGDEYRINGSYYYLTLNEKINPEDEDVFTRTTIRNFSRTFTPAQINGLYQALNIQYPSNSTYTEKRVIDLTAGAMYIVSAEPVFGLTASNWNVDN